MYEKKNAPSKMNSPHCVPILFFVIPAIAIVHLNLEAFYSRSTYNFLASFYELRILSFFVNHLRILLFIEMFQVMLE